MPRICSCAAAAPPSEGVPPTASEQQTELSGLSLRALKQRALLTNVAQAELDAVDDEVDPRGAIIALLAARETATTAWAASVRGELMQLRLKQLKARARTAGVSDAQLNTAEDEVDFKRAIVDIILEVEQPPAVDREARRAELGRLNLKPLKQHARASGVSDEQLDEAEDEEDVKAAIVQLVLSQPQSCTQPARDSDLEPEPEHSADSGFANAGGLRRELQRCKFSALKQRAHSAQVPTKQIEEAEDSDMPKESLINLILRAMETPAGHVVHGYTAAALDDHRSELNTLRLRELRARAKAADVGTDQLDDAMDADDPKAAVINLLVDLRVDSARKLESLRLKELRAKARGAGYDTDTLDEVMDSDEPKAALIELLLKPAQGAGRPALPVLGTAAEAEAQPQPAASTALDPNAANAVDQSNHPVYQALETHQLQSCFTQLIELGVKRVEDLGQLTRSELASLDMLRFDRRKFEVAFLTETPHHGASSGQDSNATVVADGGGFTFEAGKHAMFSYQWDDQARVIAAREYFASLGVSTWMDIDGGMQVDIYDSMAAGVANAAVVVAFLSQRYQDSVNCQLELKYAKQRGVPIVTVNMQDKWRASEWLGVITAGMLWTPMHDPGTQMQNLKALADQIKAAVPATAIAAAQNRPRVAPGQVASSGDSTELQSLRDQLDTLRQDLAQAVSQQVAAAADDSNAAPGVVLAPIPGEVPPLSRHLRPTSDMLKLKSLLLAGTSGSSTTAVTSEQSKIGALGMGGIGKTVTASWIARDDDVRRHFDLIVWCTCGQTPSLQRMRQLIYLQTTGRELSADATPEQATELITVAMRGRCVLLVLDDIWEAEHEAALNCIDDATTASKTLVTTRIRGLGGGAQIELGLPSEEESVLLLLSSAGLERVSPVPTEASAVVKVCGCLPLAIDLAGKMLRDLGVNGTDWTGIPELLREEMQTNGDESTVEYQVISASLSSVPVRDRADLKRVLSVFALVAEDTFVPVGAFQVMLSALTGDTALVPELKLRRWLQKLIDRSIVLGTWERYTIALFTPEELQTLQCKVVDAFAAHRPVSPDVDACGLRSWKSQPGDDTALYVHHEIKHHIRSGIDLSGSLPPSVGRWLRSYTPGSDDLQTSVAKVIGIERLEELSRTALAAGDDWLAVCAYDRYTNEAFRTFGAKECCAGKHMGPAADVEPVKQRMMLEDQRPQEITDTEYEHWAMNSCLVWKEAIAYFGVDEFFEGPLGAICQKSYYEKLAARGLFLLETTEVGRKNRRKPVEVKDLWRMIELYNIGDRTALAPMQLKLWRKEMERALDGGGGKTLHGDVLKHMADLYQGDDVEYSMIILGQPQWDWSFFERIDVLEALRSYRIDVDRIDRVGFSHPSVTPISSLWALRGDLETAHAGLGFNLAICSQLRARCEQSNSDDSEVARTVRSRLRFAVMHGLPLVLMSLGRAVEAAQLMREADLSWQTAAAQADEHAKDDYCMRDRGDTEPGKNWIGRCAEEFEWSIKLQYILCMASHEVAPTDVLAALPSPGQLMAWCAVASKPGLHYSLRQGLVNVLVLAAMVCEKLEQSADCRALSYLEQALRVDPDDPITDIRPTTQAQGYIIKGRVLAAQGKTAEAEAAFGLAVDVSHRTGLRLFEMLALKDLKAHVLDTDGRSDEGVQRLKAVLKEMKGPASELTKLLGEEGLDADTIMRS